MLAWPRNLPLSITSLALQKRACFPLVHRAVHQLTSAHLLAHPFWLPQGHVKTTAGSLFGELRFQNSRFEIQARPAFACLPIAMPPSSSSSFLDGLDAFLQPLAIDTRTVLQLSRELASTFGTLSAESLDQFLPTPISESILRPARQNHGR